MRLHDDFDLVKSDPKVAAAAEEVRAAHRERMGAGHDSARITAAGRRYGAAVKALNVAVEDAVNVRYFGNAGPAV